jgi:hypothetical protein
MKFEMPFDFFVRKILKPLVLIFYFILILGFCPILVYEFYQPSIGHRYNIIKVR